MRKVIDDAFLSILDARDLKIRDPMNGLFGGNRRSKTYGSSAEFADFREYIPGDDLRRIDWNLYARFEKLFLRLYVDERQLHHRIYIDGSASMDWGEPNKSDVALKIAAALGYLGVGAMDRVSYYAIHKKHCKPLAPTITGREAYYRAVEKLNNLEFYGNGDIGTAITTDPELGHGDGVSFIISDFLSDTNWKDAVDQLLFHKREVHLVQVLSPDEVTPALTGKLFMLDSEADYEEDRRNHRIDVTRTAVKAYQEAFAWHRKDITDFCASRKVGFISVCSDESIERMLFQKATEAEIIL